MEQKRINLFEKLGLSKNLCQSIKRLGFTKPTQIQEESIPLIMQGKDVIGESATGSGKTLAFGCGVLENVVQGRGLQALILTPTRELAEQVRQSIVDLSYDNTLKIINVYGGVAINPQIKDLKRADVVIATPGRLKDHIQRRTVNLHNIRLLALDEADRMLDMGFIDDIEFILKHCAKERQTLFFSATFEPRVKQLAQKYMNNPEKVMAKNQVDPSKLSQCYYDISKGMKFSLLVHLLEQESSDLVMIFCNTRKTTDFVVENLKNQGIKSTAIHGGLTQNKRLNTIKRFNDGSVNILVCTDVAARGLHIDNVSHVYNYELPNDSKEYIHRIGRTARAGEDGQVINLLCDYDHDNFSRIIREYRDFKIDSMERPYLKRIDIIKPEENRRSFSRGSDRRGGRDNRRSFSGNRRSSSKRSNDSTSNNRDSPRSDSREGGFSRNRNRDSPRSDSREGGFSRNRNRDSPRSDSREGGFSRNRNRDSPRSDSREGGFSRNRNRDSPRSDSREGGFSRNRNARDSKPDFKSEFSESKTSFDKPKRGFDKRKKSFSRPRKDNFRN
jgi:ATP-dependent RNA helicase DeaD